MKWSSQQFDLGKWRPRAALLGAAVVALLAAALPGCRSDSTPGSSQSQQALRRVDRGEALLKAAAAQLNDLPSDVDTQLHPPSVILDSSKSTDGQDVFAICTVTPNVPQGRINFVSVPAANSRFRSLGVKSGDALKYYILEDETVDEERRAAGLSRQLTMEFTVAQVIDDNNLLLERGIPASIVKSYMERVIDDDSLLTEQALAQGVLIPAKIEVWRYADDRLLEINRQLVLYRDRRLPPLGWEPSPDARVLTQVVVWLNQWLRQSEPKSDWQLDPLLESLDPALRSDPTLSSHISNEALARRSFEPHEGRLLQEAVWLRDVARWARGDSFDNIDRVTALFDWTVRNVQLEPDENARAHRPWQVVLYGRGTAEQRAWVFALLARQMGLDVVVLALPPDAPPDADAASVANAARFWLPALLDEGQLYLFDTRLGLPVPGPAGQGVATLQQVHDDDSLLRQLDLEAAPYPVTANALKKVQAYIVADPFDLTRRARQAESKLTGDDRLALTVKPSELASRLKPLPQIAGVRLWPLPFHTLQQQLNFGKPARQTEVLAFEPFAVRPVLWKARTRHFQGRRPVGDETNADQAPEPLDDHREAARLYTSKSVRPTDRNIEQSSSDDKRRVDSNAKLYATYCLGLLSFDDGKYDVAAHWFGRPELLAPTSPWSAGARYNLARTREAQSQFDEAVELLEQDASAQSHGNKLRARQLKAKTEKAAE